MTPARWLIPIAAQAGAFCVHVDIAGSIPGDCQESLPAWLQQA